SDVSSVVSDYLYSGKPFAMTAVSAQGDDFIEQYPIARASYVLNGDLSNLDEVLNALLETDPERKNRLKYRSFYLADFPEDGHAENVVSAEARMVSEALSHSGEVDDADDSAEEEEETSHGGDAVEGSAASAVDANLTETRTAGATLSLIYRKLGGRTLIPAGLVSLTVIFSIVEVPAMLTCAAGVLVGLGFLFVHRRSFKSKSRMAGVLRASNSAR